MLVINSRFLTQKTTGAQRFAIEICKQLKKFDLKLQFVAPKNIMLHKLAKEFDVKIIGKHTGHFWEQVELPLYLKNQSSPLLLNLVNTAPIYYKNKISTIHDVSWMHFPNAVSKKFYLWYKFLIPKIAKSSRHIFTVSEFSKKDISQKLKISPEKISIVYNAISDKFKNLGLQRKKIILAVSSIQPYKNIERLIQAFSKLDKKFSDYKLILVGDINEKVYSGIQLRKLIEKNKNIELTGYLPDKDLIKLYNEASLFVFPSLFEGFGIPPLEAMACGTPVLASSEASIPEVCADAAYYVNAYDIEDIVNGIEKTLTDEELRKKLIQKGKENLKRFSWEKSAEIIYNTVKSLELS